MLHLKTVLRGTFPLNCSEEPFCNICERFEAERKFAVFAATSRNYYLIRSQKLVPETQKILREKYREKICLETIAQKFGVSEQYLHSRFRKKTGHTIKEYLTELRLAYAVKNLENTQLSISEIRQRGGFPNPNCFFTAFRRKFGCTPQEYRDKRNCKKAK